MLARSIPKNVNLIAISLLIFMGFSIAKSQEPFELELLFEVEGFGAVAYSPDGDFLFVGRQLLDVNTGEVVIDLPNAGNTALIDKAVRFNPDGNMIAGFYLGRFISWDLESSDDPVDFRPRFTEFQFQTGVISHDFQYVALVGCGLANEGNQCGEGLISIRDATRLNTVILDIPGHTKTIRSPLCQNG